MFVEYHMIVVFSNVQIISFVLGNDRATTVEIMMGLYKELANPITLENIR